MTTFLPICNSLASDFFRQHKVRIATIMMRERSYFFSWCNLGALRGLGLCFSLVINSWKPLTKRFEGVAYSPEKTQFEARI